MNIICVQRGVFVSFEIFSGIFFIFPTKFSSFGSNFDIILQFWQDFFFIIFWQNFQCFRQDFFVQFFLTKFSIVLDRNFFSWFWHNVQRVFYSSFSCKRKFSFIIVCNFTLFKMSKNVLKFYQKLPLLRNYTFGCENFLSVSLLIKKKNFVLIN